MKMPIVLSLLMAGMSTFALAQDGANGSSAPSKKTKEVNKSYPLVKEVSFTFGDGGSISVPKKIKTGDFYRVKVDGINLNNYRVELQVKDTVYYSKALDFPVFGSIDLSGLEGVLGIFKDLDITTEQQGVEGDSTIKKDPDMKQIVDKDSLNALNKEINRIKEVLNTQEDTLKGIGKNLTDQVKLVDSLIYEFKKRKMLSKVEPAQSFEPIDLKSTMNTFESLRSQLKTIESKQNLGKKAYDDFFSNAKVISLLRKIKDEPVGIEIAKERENIEKAYAELSKIWTKAQALVSLGNEEKSFLSVYQLYTNTTYTSLPIQFTGEEAEIKMSFIPKDSASNLQTYHLSPIKFGRSPWYWAVGPGIFLSGLENKRVGLKTFNLPDSTQEFQVVEENSLKGEVGVSALFHAGRRIQLGSIYGGVHLSVGTGVSLGEEVRARMLYGGGISLGEKNHLVIDVGWARGYVDVFAKEFSNGIPSDRFSEKPTILVQDLETSWFLSFGYMFTF
ncbi:hypothetical protein [Algoriphagus marincola]|uniref:hypothetical protein n=1 Tax=Algoriphagus marincola TaxID=264027 RepID=UPI0003FD09A9|nr:hypothetical protein [Algoriphagus marincola]